MIDIAKARALCEAQYGAKSDPEVFRAAALDLLPEALDALEQVRAVCVTITTALKQAIVERDALDAENARLTATALTERIRAAEAVCEAADSVSSEPDVSDLHSCYNMGVELGQRLAAWRKVKIEP